MVRNYIIKKPICSFYLLTEEKNEKNTNQYLDDVSTSQPMIELAVILNLLTYLFLAVKYSWNSFFLSYWNKRDLIGWSTISIVSSFVLLFTIQVVSCLFFRFFTIFQDSLFFIWQHFYSFFIMWNFIIHESSWSCI